MKKCSKCGAEKDESMFSKGKRYKDGLFCQCKECCSKRFKTWRSKNKERESERFKQYRADNAEYEAARKRKYTKEHLPEINEHNRKRREECPERHKAHAAVRRAVESSKLWRQPCEVCGWLFTHAHHDDYSKPLEVRWLCPQHHSEVHKKEVVA